MISFYIYSKDRACQLHLLIQSILKFYPKAEIHVLYDYSDREYLRAYNMLWARFPEINIHIQTDFKSDVIYMLEKIKTEYVLGLSDDCVFINSFDFQPLRDNNIHGVSVHLNKDYKSCYTSDKTNNIQIPKFTKDHYLIWEWIGQQSTWGYPCGVEGNIVRCERYLELCKLGQYDNPNEMEGQHVKRKALFPPKMACFENTKVINMPINRVQETYKNKFGLHHPYTAEELNNIYLKGQVINLDKIKQTGTDFYQEMELEFINDK